MFQHSLPIKLFCLSNCFRILTAETHIIVTKVLQLAATLLRTEHDLVSTSFLLSRRIFLWYTLLLSDPVHHRPNTTLQKKTYIATHAITSCNRENHSFSALQEHRKFISLSNESDPG